MKKKLLAYVCMIACIFGLTACGSGEELTAYEQSRVDSAGNAATVVVSLFADYLCQGNPFVVEELETNEEIEYLCEQYFGVMVNGNAVATGVQSFTSGLETIGGITDAGEAKIKIDGKQIIVEVPITGEKQNAVAEIIFSNDLNLDRKSTRLNNHPAHRINCAVHASGIGSLESHRIHGTADGESGTEHLNRYGNGIYRTDSDFLYHFLLPLYQ